MRKKLNWIGLVTIAICCASAGVRGQAQTPDDVVRINTELVQSDVMVFDRRGRFVDGLKPEQFILTLNGETKPIAFFERSGAAMRSPLTQPGAKASTPMPAALAAAPEGRVIFFFVDDVHLSAESLTRARSTLSRFIDSRINENDRVAVVSTSGQIGFLQQLTDDPAVLREAIARLNYKQNPEAYAGHTRISEYAASRVADGGDRRLFAYLMESVKLEYGMGLGSLRGDHSNNSAGQAMRLLQSRVSQINAQSKAATADTLTVFQSLVDSSASIPGRKLVFFLSDGFVTDPRSTNALARLREATKLAAKSGAVVYSVDMRGSFLDASVDAGNNDYVDMSGRHGGVGMGEVMEPRQPLNLLADDTGGRMMVRSNDLDKDLNEAVAETSSYYLLAWRPTSDVERNGKARLEVRIADRPDLKVRLRRAYFVPPTAPASAPSMATVDGDAQLLLALGSTQPVRTLPAYVSVGYVRNQDSSLVLQASMEIPREAFSFDQGKQSVVDVVGAAIDDRGLIYTFKQVLTATPAPANDATLPVIWHQALTVKPGLYQVRLAVRERATGRTGSAMQWIDLRAKSEALSMSSLFLGERRETNGTSNEPQSIAVEADRSFARNSVLRFQTYLYGAAAESGTTNVWVNARLLRGSQTVLTISPNRVPTLAKDLSRLPYWSEIALANFSPGWYTLEISANDRIAGSTVTQRTRFSIE